jgi:hypothetical protein
MLVLFRFGLELRHVHVAVVVRSDRHNAHAAHGGTGRVGAVRRGGDDAHVAVHVAAGAVVGPDGHEARVLPRGARVGLQRHRVKARDLGQHGAQVRKHLLHADKGRMSAFWPRKLGEGEKASVALTAITSLGSGSQGKHEKNLPHKVFYSLKSSGAFSFNRKKHLNQRRISSRAKKPCTRPPMHYLLSPSLPSCFLPKEPGPHLVALGLVEGGEGVDVGELGPGDGDHLGGGVQLHGAGAEGDHAVHQRQVLGLQPVDVPQQLVLRVVPGTGQREEGSTETGQDIFCLLLAQLKRVSAFPTLEASTSYTSPQKFEDPARRLLNVERLCVTRERMWQLCPSQRAVAHMLKTG